MTPLSTSAPPLGVYVHVPYCLRRCGYCDFYSVARPADARFVPALLRELKQRASLRQFTGPAHSLYLGGGTPSLLSPAQVQQIIVTVEEYIGLRVDAEITLEANPAEIDERRAGDLRATGVNRLSLGVQSLDDRWLQVLGRRHNASRACAAVGQARRAGFDNLSLDLIVGIPGQSLADSRNDVKALLDLAAPHVSIYQLSLEAGTPMQRAVDAGEIEPVDTEICADILDQSQQLCAAAGLRRYEISNHALPGHEAAHNRLYWSGGRYLGLGPGAHSHWVDASGCGWRCSNTKNLDLYLDHLAPKTGRAIDLPGVQHEKLDPPRYQAERLYLGLRDLVRGVALSEIEGQSRRAIGGDLLTVLRDLEKDGLIVRFMDRLRLSTRGADLADEVGRRLLSLQ